MNKIKVNIEREFTFIISIHGVKMQKNRYETFIEKFKIGRKSECLASIQEISKEENVINKIMKDHTLERLKEV